MSKEEMSVEDKAEFLIAVRNYKCGKRKKWSNGVDFVASDGVSDEKVLVRLIKPQNRLRFVGADEVTSMLRVMRSEGCVKGVLIGRRFSAAATREMNTCNIQQVSDEYMPPVKLENMVLTISECVNNLCKTKCGTVPLRASDCKANVKDRFCRVRSISDDALFHRERGWMDLLKNDLRQLLLLNKTITA
jgi:hypothetical protein